MVGDKRGRTGPWGRKVPPQLSPWDSCPLACRSDPAPTHIAKSADPHSSKHGGSRRLRSPAAAHMAHHVGHMCVTEVTPGLYKPTQHWEGGSLYCPFLTVGNTSLFDKMKRRGRLGIICTVYERHSGAQDHSISRLTSKPDRALPTHSHASVS